jgi:hypothetical protein
MHFAMNEFLEAILSTQHTVGWLSLNKATYLWSNSGQISSITSHKSRSPAISRSEFVMDPSGFLKDYY